MWLRAESETRHGDTFQARDDTRAERIDSTLRDNFICRHRRTLITPKRTPSYMMSSFVRVRDSPKPMLGTPLQIPRESQLRAAMCGFSFLMRVFGRHNLALHAPKVYARLRVCW